MTITPFFCSHLLITMFFYRRCRKEWREQACEESILGSQLSLQSWLGSAINHLYDHWQLSNQRQGILPLWISIFWSVDVVIPLISQQVLRTKRVKVPRATKYRPVTKLVFVPFPERSISFNSHPTIMIFILVWTMLKTVENWQSRGLT